MRTTKNGMLVVTLAAALLGAPTIAADKSATTLPDNFTLAAVGDIIYLRPAAAFLGERSEPLLSVLREADVAFGNFESNAFPLRTFRGSLQSPIEGPALLTTLPALRELRDMGFDLLSHANNHSFDFGAEGILETNRHLKNAGFAAAGSGADLRAARAAAYFPKKRVRVALIAATSTYPEAALAANAWGPLRPRPGVSGLQVQAKILVSPDAFKSLKELSSAGLGARVDGPTSDEVRLFGQTFRADAAVQNRPGYAYSMADGDREGILAAIREARRSSPLVIFSLHTHQPTADQTVPPDFVVNLAHAAVDAGADVFVAHGPHQLRGIEIYRGKPIFYSLANFAIMQPSPDLNPAPLNIPPGSIFTQRAFFESVVAVVRYRNGEWTTVELHPFELAQTNELSSHGLPQPVDAEKAQAIIERMQKLSSPFGTRVAIEKDRGVIRRSEPNAAAN
jgi:poly-gamma-glutamate capsule biosynthesis protein CapA/YwtB (metallophosphatase superfamily)